MDYIFSTDTTLTAINKINNRITGITYDDALLFWIPITSSTSGASISKRDPKYPNNVQMGGAGNQGYNFVAGGGNKINTTNSFFNTIFAGTGHTIDDINNTIFAGQNNSILNNFLSGNTNSSILGGIKNTMNGLNNTFLYSTILNGSGNTIFKNVISNNSNYLYNRNTIINGIKNTISGITGLSWIGNGTGNTISTTNTQNSLGNYILNGHDNNITNTSTNYGYNTIIGGSNNEINDLNNSIVIGSNLTALNSDTTHVNRMFFDKKIFVNSATYSGVSSSNTTIYFDGINYWFNFNHNNNLIGIIKNQTNAPLFINLKNGNYIGQTLYLISIPGYYGPILGTYPQTSLLFSSSTYGYNTNIISKDLYAHPITGDTHATNAENWSGLSIFVWDGTYWIRADHRGGV